MEERLISSPLVANLAVDQHPSAQAELEPYRRDNASVLTWSYLIGIHEGAASVPTYILRTMVPVHTGTVTTRWALVMNPTTERAFNPCLLANYVKPCQVSSRRT